MTVDALQAMFVEHWLSVGLVLCPVLVVMMALAALSCEACGAPFGIFRRRQRTIDLCIRCAVLHDIRSANDQKAAAADAAASPQSDITSDAASKSRSESRAFVTQSPVQLDDAHPVAR